jgi:hypothetical protein
MGYFRRLHDNFGIIWKCNFIFAFQLFLPKTDKNRAYAFIGRRGLTPYPYKFMLEYKKKKHDVFMDENLRLPYVIHHNQRLYFPKNYNVAQIQGLYRSLLVEQDIRSPHRYVNSYHELTGCTLFDIGAAEGIFTLDTIEYVQHAYLFECDDAWIAALSATFSAWRSKVSIIKRCVSDVDDGEKITLDTFLRGKNVSNIFLKMDVEGYEQSVLRGAWQTLSNSSAGIRFSVCTYHKSNDAKEISAMLSESGFECQFTEGFLFFEKELRKAVVRGKKSGAAQR